MKRVLTILLFCWVMSLPMTSSAQSPLDEFKWKNRIVLVNVDDVKSSEYQLLKESYLKQLMEIDSRDLLFIGVGTEQAEFWTIGDKQLSPQQVQYLRDNYLKGNQQVLIGKDGEVKRNTSGSFAPQELFNIIDQMPMRRSEVRRGNN